MPESYTPGSDSASTIYLVSCVKSKRSEAAPARELYTSTWFQRARAFVEPTGSPWYVLSARYGLLEPDEVIPPYEQTLNHMNAAERREWARRVQSRLDELTLEDKRVVLLAGRLYREPILDYLHSRAAAVETPMARLAQGQQLQWLGEQIGARSSNAGGQRTSAASTQRPQGVARALLDLDERLAHEDLIPTVEDGAARFILEDPYAFLLASCLNRGTSAAIIWTIPSWLKRHWGHLDPHRIRAMSDEHLARAIDELPKRPRYSSDPTVFTTDP